MLQIKIPLTQEEWDEENEVFVEPKFQILQKQAVQLCLEYFHKKLNINGTVIHVTRIFSPI